MIFNTFLKSRHFPKSLYAVLEIIAAMIAPVRAPSPQRKFLSSERAASEMVGQIMLLAVTVIGIGTITVYGLPTILSLQDMANARNGEQSLTVIDSQISKAILGFSPGQTDNINLGGGTLTVIPNSTSPSYITVTSNNFSFTIPMGKIEYSLSDRTVAYEGGGMWTKYPSGRSIMLSPPALHYDGVTLSLPVINISGSGSVGGKGVATLSVTKSAPVPVFPNTSTITGYQTSITGYNTVQVPQPPQTNMWDFSGVPTWSNACSVYCTNTVSIGGQLWTFIINSQGQVDTGSTYGNPPSSIDAEVGSGVAGTMTWQSPNFTFNGILTSANISFDRQVPTYSGGHGGKDCPSTCSFSVVLVKPDGNKSVIYPNTPFSSSLRWMTLSNNSILSSDFTINGNYSLQLIATLSEKNSGSGLYFVWDNINITLNYNTSTQVPVYGTIPVYDTNRTNPVKMSKAGNIYVNITSDFYDAWYSYAESLGYVNASKNDSTRTVSLNLLTVPNNLGENTSITNPIIFSGLNTSDTMPLDNFSFMLVPFNSRIDWDIRTKNSASKLIFDVTGTNQTSPVSISIGYQNGSGPGTAETWNYTGYFPVQNDSFYIDMLNTSLYLAYRNITVSAKNNNSCQPFGGVINQDQQNFSNTGFSWIPPLQTGMQTTQYNWNSSEPWTPSMSLGGGTGSNLVYSSDGYPAPPSLKSTLTSNPTLATATWKSPNFTWTNGTPVSARLDFYFKVSSMSGSPAYFYVNLVKPNGTSQIYPTTSFSSTTGWLPYSNPISANNFNQSGNYSLQLVLQTNSSVSSTVLWDNETITLVSSLNKSLYDITEHYFWLMNKNGDGELSFGNCGTSQPGANSTMLMNYTPTGGFAYLQISDNQVDASIS